eukprot:6477300-Amphidinium_carterae.2
MLLCAVLEPSWDCVASLTCVIFGPSLWVGMRVWTSGPPHKDRYVQAKRHAWAITQLCWVMAIRDRLRISSSTWIGLLCLECGRS